MKYFVVLFLILFPTIFLSAQVKQEEYPFKEKYSFDGSDCYLKSDIELENTDLIIGTRYKLKYTINVAVYCPLYNPFFNGLIPPTGQLALYDENKKYVTDLTKSLGGSRRSPSRGDWVFMYSGFIGSNLSFLPGNSFFDLPLNELKEGAYYLQLIFYRSLYSTPWEDILPVQDESYFYKNYSKKEFLRSNAIKIKVTKSK